MELPPSQAKRSVVELSPPPAKPVLWLVQQRAVPVNQVFAVGQTAIHAWQAARLKDELGVPLDFASVHTSIVPEHLIESVQKRLILSRMQDAPSNGAPKKAKKKRAPSNGAAKKTTKKRR